MANINIFRSLSYPMPIYAIIVISSCHTYKSNKELFLVRQSSSFMPLPISWKALGFGIPGSRFDCLQTPCTQRGNIPPIYKDGFSSLSSGIHPDIRFWAVSLWHTNSEREGAELRIREAGFWLVCSSKYSCSSTCISCRVMCRFWKRKWTSIYSTSCHNY